MVKHTTIVVSIALIFVLPCLPQESSAEDLSVDVAMLVVNRDLPDPPFAFVDVVWSNSWMNERSNDAAWVFLKSVNGGRYNHLKVASATVVGSDADGFVATVANDSNGFWVESQKVYSGDVNVRVKVVFLQGEDSGLPEGASVTAYGIEMVRIAAGSFFAGDPSDSGQTFGALYMPGESGDERDYFHVESENSISVGSGQGQMYYPEGSYLGDQSGPVPVAFPKGTRAFYIMKYELSQGQYVDMLNSLSGDASYKRVNFMVRSYYADRGSIDLRDGEFVADFPERPMVYATWDDQLAFADWAALRPLTELEFEKAARGPERPNAGDYPWGTNNRSELKRMVDGNGDTITAGFEKEPTMSLDMRPVVGASYYMVMDLAGNVWERVITLGSPDGRAFSGSHGDGRLDGGSATNADWPIMAEGKEGHGYRGGGYYGSEFATHEFNPFSPVGYRRFGAWSGGSPHRAYGFRAARTAPQER